jgi:type I restriction enzyme M protein
VGGEQAWKVSAKEIAERGWNLDLKNPHRGAEVSLDPEVLLAEYGRIHAEIADLREQLRVALADSLEQRT